VDLGENFLIRRKPPPGAREFRGCEKAQAINRLWPLQPEEKVAKIADGDSYRAVAGGRNISPTNGVRKVRIALQPEAGTDPRKRQPIRGSRGQQNGVANSGLIMLPDAAG